MSYPRPETADGLGAGSDLVAAIVTGDVVLALMGSLLLRFATEQVESLGRIPDSILRAKCLQALTPWLKMTRETGEKLLAGRSDN